MDAWTLAVVGMAVLPLIGLAFVVADIYDAHVDLVRVKWWYPPPSIEHEQAHSNLWGQIARATSLVLLSSLAVWHLLPFDLPREGVLAILYGVIIVKVTDSIRARLTRKKMIQYLSDNPNSGFTSSK